MNGRKASHVGCYILYSTASPPRTQIMLRWLQVTDLELLFICAFNS